MSTDIQPQLEDIKSRVADLEKAEIKLRIQSVGPRGPIGPVETVETHYAQFVPAARDAVQTKMDAGVGIEEQARIASQRGTKVVGIR